MAATTAKARLMEREAEKARLAAERAKAEAMMELREIEEDEVIEQDM